MVHMPAPIDHDQIFKHLIEAFFREFVELFCRNESALIDFARVEFLRDRRERVRLKADFLRWILGAPVDPARRGLLVDFVETYMPL